MQGVLFFTSVVVINIQAFMANRLLNTLCSEEVGARNPPATLAYAVLSEMDLPLSLSLSLSLALSLLHFRARAHTPHALRVASALALSGLPCT